MRRRFSSRTYSRQKSSNRSRRISLSRSATRTRSSTSWRLMVKRLVHVPRERAPKHARRSRQYMTYPPPHSAHFVRPEKRYFGRRARLNCLGSPFDATRRISACRAFTWLHSSSSTIRSSGTTVVTHSDGGFGLETRLPVSGSLTYRRRFQTSRPT